MYATGIYGIVRLVCVIIAMHFFVDRFGRKNMLIGGAVVMLVAMVSRTGVLRALEVSLTCVFTVVHWGIHQNRQP